MRDRDNSEVWTAVAIGAVIGIGTALLMRARQEDDTHAIIRKLRPVQRQVKEAAGKAGKSLGKQARRAGHQGDELLSSGREVMEELRRGARDIVRSTRKELRKAARDSMKEARKAARALR